jgi:hypothetical protein
MPEPLNFVTEAEPWNIYRLEDGTVIRAKVVLCKVTVRDGERDQEGNPVYDMRWQQICDVTPGEHLRDTPQAKEFKS